METFRQCNFLEQKGSTWKTYQTDLKMTPYGAEKDTLKAFSKEILVNFQPTYESAST